jgi:PST family polysaccharide transporter
LRPFQPDGTFLSITTGRGLRRSAVRGAGTAIAGAASNFAVQMGAVVILARLLTPGDFGIVTMVTTFSLLLRSFGINGFTELIIQRKEMTESLANNFFWMNLGIGTILTVAFAYAGSLLALLYHTPDVAQVTRGMSITIVISCLGYVHMALLQRAMQFRTAAIINFIGQVLQYGVSIALAIAGWHYWALVWGSVVQAATVTIGSLAICQWMPGLPGRAKGTGTSFKFAMNVYSHYAFSYSTRNLDNLLVGWRFGDRALGFYKRAYDLFVLPESQLLAPLSAVAVSTLSRVQHDREQFIRYFLQMISVLALVGMGVGANFALIGEDVMRLLLGPGWGESGRIFALFGPGIGIMLLYNTHGWIHLSIGRPERWFRWGLIEFACIAVLFFVTLHWGPSGIAFAWTASYFLLMFPGFWYAGKPINLGVGPIFNVIWRFFVASVLAGGSTALIFRNIIKVTISPGPPSIFLRMCLVSLVFYALYIGFMILLYGGLKPLNDAAGIIREFLPERMNRRASSMPADIEASEKISEWSADIKLDSELLVVPDKTGSKV